MPSNTKSVSQLEKELWKTDQQRKHAWKQYFEIREHMWNERKAKSDQLKELKAQLEQVKESVGKSDAVEGMLKIIKRQADELKEKLSCPVCNEEELQLDKITVTKCGHIFCSDCLKTWTKDHEDCPICRTKIKLF